MADADALERGHAQAIQGDTQKMFTAECRTRNNCKQMHTLLKYIGQRLY